MQDPDGIIVWSTGTYQEIVPLEKIVTTDSFADQNGKTISANSVGIPAEMHDDCVSAWNSSLNKFQVLDEKIIRFKILLPSVR